MNAEKIKKFVEDNKELAVQFLVDAVRIPSVSGNELEVSKFFQKKFDEMNLDTEIEALDESRPNLISTWHGKSNGPTFIFNGHYDVFPPVAADPGIYGPWAGKIVDGSIYGRGTVDMKGGLCAAVMAVDFLKRLNFEPKGNIVLSCDVDEELGGKFGVEYLLSQNLLHADFGICMEPTRSLVQVEGGGGIFLEVTYTSETWHGGAMKDDMDALQKGVLAAQKLYDLDKKIQKEKYYEPLGGGAMLSITMLNAGEVMNTHPSQCKFIIDRRLVPGETPEGVQQEIQEVLDDLKQDYPEMDYEIEFLSRMPALHVDENHPLIKAGLNAIEEVTGKKTDVYRRTGGSDNHKIVEKYGICMPNFGPGKDFEETTSPNEHLEVQEYLDIIKMYMLMVVKLLG